MLFYFLGKGKTCRIIIKHFPIKFYQILLEFLLCFFAEVLLNISLCKTLVEIDSKIVLEMKKTIQI